MWMWSTREACSTQVYSSHRKWLLLVVQVLFLARYMMEPYRRVVDVTARAADECLQEDYTV